MRQQENKGPRQQTAAMSEEGEDNHRRLWRVELRTMITSVKRRMLKKTLYRIFRGRIAKQKAGSYVASQRIKDWALWRGQPPLKGLKSILACLG
jgi:hypothetical protein